jgi:trans-2,3-dihydro-3-hydroxyanthranilate isomerase
MRALRYVLCDVFTDRPLEGNPLAVFTDAAGIDSALMQALASEMNLSESVFVLRAEAPAHARIRIFTPRQEVPFAGHPVLGTAFVLGASVHLDEIRLMTGKGIVPVRLEREGARPSFGWMDQPLPAVEPFAEASELCAALGVKASESRIETYDNGIRHSFVELVSREAVAAVRPDFSRLAKIASEGVSTFSASGCDVKTRMFAPAAGVHEDPATGSAAGPLALHLARLGRIDFGEQIRIEQGAELGRPSVLFARASGSRDAALRVEVGGAAVMVARGEFRLSL